MHSPVLPEEIIIRIPIRTLLAPTESPGSLVVLDTSSPQLDSLPASTTLYPVIVIDDDPDDLFFITRRINKSGVRNPVMTFNDGADAVNHFRHLCDNPLLQAPACIVFSDIKMPRMGGFDVLRWFRAEEKLSAIRFVMLSGSNELVDRRRAESLGAHDYLVKFPPEDRFAALITSANRLVESAFRPVA